MAREMKYKRLFVRVAISFALGQAPLYCMADSGSAPDSASRAEASAAPEMPAYISRARWSEGWSILSSPDPDYDDSTLSFKNIRLDDSGENYLSFGGEDQDYIRLDVSYMF